MTRERLLEQLLGYFVDEIERGIEPRDAGWVAKMGKEVDDLCRLGVCEKEDEKIRVNLRQLPKQIVTRLSDDGKWLADVHAEITKAMTVEEKIVQVVEDASLHPAAVLKGWGDMLGSSSFPVMVDRVFREGFARDEWYARTSDTAVPLSLSVVEKWWKMEDLETALRKLSIAICIKRGGRDGEKVRKILKWNKVVETLKRPIAFALGLLWYADDLIVTERLRHPESIMYVQKGTWRLITQILRKDEALIREKVDEVVAEIESATADKDKLGYPYAIANWSGIIRMPW